MASNTKTLQFQGPTRTLVCGYSNDGETYEYAHNGAGWTQTVRDGPALLPEAWFSWNHPAWRDQ